MTLFEVASQRDWLVFMLVVQLLYGAGVGMLYGFYFPVLGSRISAFIVTGTPALALVPIGFFTLPSVIARRKLAGTYDFVRTFPVPRGAAIAATTTVFATAALLGLVVALVVTTWRYGVPLQVSPLIVPAMLLSSVMAVSVGAALGHSIGNPLVTILVGNLVMFLVLLFTPVVLPPENYPTWLVDVHKQLPFYNMAVVLRDALSTHLVTHVLRSYVVLGAWTVAGLAVCARVVSRRP